MIEELQEKLRKLAVRRNPLEGCIRRNVLDTAPSPWRYVRGNAVLDAMADRHTVHLPTGQLYDIHIAADVVVLFRGGKQRPWWHEDAQLQAACVVTFASHYVQATIITTELDNEIGWLYIPIPADPTSVALAAYRGLQAEPIARLDKLGARASATCRFCSVRTDCDRIDLQYGHTDDWETAR